MSRPGITYHDVATAAHELKGLGRNVTIENVRGILGTGSIGTINQHLRKWKDMQQATHAITSKENLPHDLVGLMKGLWEGVITQSAQQFLPTEEAYKQELQALKSELEKYKNNNRRWQKLFNRWQQDKTDLTNEKLTLEQALQFAHKENQSLRDKQDGVLCQLQEKQDRIDELQRLHQQTQQNLEHYRELTREQRLLDQQQFERDKQQLQLELKNTREQLAIQHHQYIEMHQQHQLLNHSYVQLEKNYQEVLSDKESMKDKIKQCEKSHIENQKMSEHWQKQYRELEKKFENKITELMALQSDNKILNQQLTDTKKLLCNAQDQNKLLTREKWELAEEKAMIEGQLKQMQQMIYAKEAKEVS